MTLTIEISPELEKRLHRKAGRRGVAAEECVRLLLEERRLPTASKPLWAVATLEEWEAAFDRWLTSHDPTLPPLPEEALRRESFYGDRG